MTFEEYKNKGEVFGKIDTPEKLAFYKRQYENHLLHVEDENYFEPFENRLINDLSSQYEQNLKQIFSLDNIQENQFCFLVQPSFEPEYLLRVTRQPHNYLLTHTTLTKNYWTVFYSGNKVTVIDSQSLEAQLTKAIGDKLSSLLDKTIAEARQPRSKSFTLDGVVYILSKMSEGKSISVFKHSPNEDSKSGKIISIMEQLISNIQTLDYTILGDIEKKIDELNAIIHNIT